MRVGNDFQIYFYFRSICYKLIEHWHVVDHYRWKSLTISIYCSMFTRTDAVM